MKRLKKVVDLFAGGGGVSKGIEAAIRAPVDVAVNHWPVAIAVHAANHPKTRHFISDVWKVKPEEAVGEAGVSLLWASPDCTHHSVARGGKPRQQKLRTLPWSVVRWAHAKRPDLIIVENVPEFRNWGPLDMDKTPIKARAGETFRAWVRKLERLGYQVEHRVLVASDYGAPTRRKRLFVIARCDGRPIYWPEQTHGSPNECRLNPQLKPWHTAAECIDWSLPCPSIFTRKKPLKPKTMWRIFKGLQRFVLENPRPFIVGAGGRAGQSPATGADEPLGTITGKNDRAVVTPVLTRYNTDERGRSQQVDAPISTIDTANRFGLLAPHLVKVNHGKQDARGEQLTLPMSTVTAGRRGHALVAPILARTAHGDVDRNGKRRGQGAHTADEPIPTVTGSKDCALVAPHLVAIDQQSSGDTSSSAVEPLHTVVAKNRSAMVTAFLAKNYGGVVGVPFDGRPLDTVTAQDHHSLAAATLVKFRGTGKDQHPGASPEEPVPTISAGGIHVAEVRAFLSVYYGQDGSAGQMLAEPMRTITAKARLGIVTVQTTRGPVDYQIVDIGFRMLRSHELLKATCGRYAKGYDLSAATTEEARVRLIGNMVPPELVEAVVRANVRPRARKRAA